MSKILFEKLTEDDVIDMEFDDLTQPSANANVIGRKRLRERISWTADKMNNHPDFQDGYSKYVIDILLKLCNGMDCPLKFRSSKKGKEKTSITKLKGIAWFVWRLIHIEKWKLLSACEVAGKMYNNLNKYQVRKIYYSQKVNIDSFVMNKLQKYLIKR